MPRRMGHSPPRNAGSSASGGRLIHRARPGRRWEVIASDLLQRLGVSGQLQLLQQRSWRRYPLLTPNYGGVHYDRLGLMACSGPVPPVITREQAHCIPRRSPSACQVQGRGAPRAHEAADEEYPLTLDHRQEPLSLPYRNHDPRTSLLDREVPSSCCGDQSGGCQALGKYEPARW